MLRNTNSFPSFRVTIIYRDDCECQRKPQSTGANRCFTIFRLESISKSPRSSVQMRRTINYITLIHPSPKTHSHPLRLETLRRYNQMHCTLHHLSPYMILRMLFTTRRIYISLPVLALPLEMPVFFNLWLAAKRTLSRMEVTVRTPPTIAHVL